MRTRPFSFIKKAICTLALGALPMAPCFTAPVFDTREDLLDHIKNKRNFSFDIDQDFNQFPDPWFMEESKGFQTYHSIRIDKDGHNDKNSLKIVFSGGKAGVYTAPLKLDSRYAYNIQLSFKGSALGERFSNKLELGLKAYDKNNQLLEDLPRLIENEFSNDWQKSKVLRIERLPEGTDSCSLYVHLEGRPSGKSELWIDQIEIISSPRIHFDTGKPLNVYRFEDPIKYKVEIDGTNPNEPYLLDLEITDFMGNSIEKKSYPFVGDMNTKEFKEMLNKQSSGVYNLNAKLIHHGKTLLKLKEIMARNTPVEEQVPNQKFGVLLGHPKAPFDDLILSLELLGTQISKLSLLPLDFQITSSLKNNHGIKELDDLLLKKAPDSGYQFIASLDHIPGDTIKDKYNPPKNVIETFVTHQEAWQKTFDRLIFHYGNVLTDWQFGSDQDQIDLQQIEDAKLIVDHLQKTTDWMEIISASQKPFTKEGFVNNLFIPKEFTLKELNDNLSKNNWSNLVATLELHSSITNDPLLVIEDMVKKISFLMAQKDRQGNPLVERLFIDSLTDELGAGLMNEKYEPQSTYFAAKTMIHWTYGAEFIGSFQHPDKSIKNYAFKRGNEAFAIFWRDSKNAGIKPAQYSLGSDVEWMDLMGNKSAIAKGSDGSILLPLSKTPAFLLSPNPKLWETMLSLKLTKSPLKSKVELQNQIVSVSNHFSKEANFEVSVRYPQGWTLENGNFETQILPNAMSNFDLSLSPSAQSPVNTPIPVYTHIDISFKNNNHHVVAYREEILLSDVKMDLSFFEEGENLEMVILIGLNNTAPAATSFIASALMPNGETFEAFFRNLQPGQNNSKRIFILNGKNMIGKNATLSVREQIGQRYLNAKFPIDTSF